MKFKIKNCPHCAYWNSLQRFYPKEFCSFHESKEDQPPAIIKAIKKEKRSLRNKRMVLWTFTLLVILFLPMLLNWEAGKFKWLASAIIYGFYLLISALIIIAVEKETQEELKELQKKQSEWIIEYE